MDDRIPRDRSAGAGDADDGVGRLIRLTGHHTAADAERKRRVRAAVETHWRRETARRAGGWTFRRTAALAAAAAVVVAVGVGLYELAPPGRTPQPLPPAQEAIAEIVVGTVFSTPVSARPDATVPGTGEPTTPLRKGQTIPAGTWITTGSDGKAALRLGDGESVRLDTGTRLAVLLDGALSLTSGAVYVDSGDTGTARPHVAIETPLGLVTDIGTQFEVRVEDEAVRVRVREGTVSLRPDAVAQAPAPRALGPGDEARLDATGRVEIARIDPFSPEWDWVDEITPMLDLDGRTAREFLEWAARERGLELRFDDPALERKAATTRLEGSIEGLTIGQALDAVLPTCGMTHAEGGGRLTVSAAP